jgi:hydroxymethylbilane synthase
MNSIQLTGRKSKLSLIQIETVKQAILSVAPHTNIQVQPMQSLGDQLKEAPLQLMEGTDFFTEAVYKALQNGEADIAVHSLKDMSGEHLFSHAAFAVVERDDVRDIAIFNPDITTRLQWGLPIRIGTSSPRRADMAVHFLQKALPALGKDVLIENHNIRGNVEERLQKLRDGQFDAIILATAGLNRLLRSESSKEVVTELLNDTKKMLLPIDACVPAPGQGALLAEAHPDNPTAVGLLQQINHALHAKNSLLEKKMALQYGKGCDQRFGLTSIAYDGRFAWLAAGIDQHGQAFEDWYGLPEKPVGELRVFSAVQFMKSFADFFEAQEAITIEKPVVFVASKNAFKQMTIQTQLKDKNVWAAGTHTWYALAAAGIWVIGCADGFGLEQLEHTLQMPLLNIAKEDITILTHEKGSNFWQQKNWHTTITYRSEPKSLLHFADQIKEANFFFWTNVSQYEQCHQYINHSDTIHACPSGATATQLQALGLNPIIFPTIQSFKAWSKQHGL